MYELAPEPTSLFQEGLMRKSQKSALAQLLRSKVPLEYGLPNDAMYIVDGGYLLHVVIWPPKPTYGKICDSYVSYVVRHFSTETIVVFDGYDSAMSTKVSEQKRRATKSSSRDIMIDESMKAVTSQSAFLNNNTNKSKLITLLVNKFNDRNIKTRQANAYADRLIHVIVETAFLEIRNSYPIVVIANDNADVSRTCWFRHVYALLNKSHITLQHNTYSRGCFVRSWKEESDRFAGSI